MMDGRIREEDSKYGLKGATLPATGHWLVLGSSTTGRCGRQSSSRSSASSVQKRETVSRLETITAKGFSTRRLRAGSLHSRSVCGIYRQVEPAQPFYGDDITGAQYRNRLGDWIVEREALPSRVTELQLRAAVPASVGLGVEAPVARVLVFSETVRAHRKDRH